ncbi:auxin transport protein BIG [Dendrobium catenatum]|uniref:Auxin transport protein BIG n=1 Tax=Dendrobium catenatum TaxID=906689 RepID=A0A2I0W0C8_9ASPA|nr:auxin transport protein BIG [Dendrobium catenatum]PKU69107.1 Auxin transport protein BIG [Dendrobium catenatum]
MAEITRLLEILSETRPPRFSQKLLSGAARPGLKAILSILEEGIRVADQGRLVLQSWSRPQIEAVISVAEVIVAASLSISVEQQDLLLVAIAQKSLELCLCSLEKFSFDGGDFSLQNNCLHIMEMALISSSTIDHHATKNESLNTLLGLLPPITIQDGSGDFKNGPASSLKGINYLKEGYSVDRVLKFLSLDSSNPDCCLPRQFSEYPNTQFSDKIMSIAQHWAVVCLNCFPRLLILCEQLLQPPISFDDRMDDGSFSSRVAFVGRIFKFLGHLMREVTLDTYAAELLHAVAGCADAILPLFKLKMDFLNFDPANTGNNLGSLVLLVLEEFLHFIQIGFLDGPVTQNVRVCIVASMLDILDCNSWRYDSLQSSVEAPLVYWPQFVLYMVKLLKDAKSWMSHDKKFVLENYYLVSDTYSPCCIGSGKILLLRNYTCEEYVSFIFPQSKQWVDGLIQLAFFLHSEGEDLKAKFDKPRLTVLKTSISMESDGGANHEDEALFGDLFCEANRPIGFSDGVEQPPLAVCGTFESYHLPIQAASELLFFLKVCIFSPEWDSTIFEHAFRMVNENHIDWLLLMLGCHNCLFEAEKGTVAPSKGTMHVSQICYDLLLIILGHQALSSSLREKLVDKVLRIENGMHIYNSYALALLAHILVSHLKLDRSHLTMKIFSEYVGFVLGKVESVCFRCPDSNDFLKTLPCSFHLEILLMAFHLSNETEKAAIANFISSSFRQINAPPDGCSAKQLSYWAIVVSKLLLILRHMLLYPRTFPSWLLLRMRSKLREIASGKSLYHSLDDHMPSWASIVADMMFEDCGKMSIDVIWHSQLIDVTPLFDPQWREDSSIKWLGLNWSDISATTSWILDFWRDKKAEAVEHLIIERYIFFLCWGTISNTDFDDSSCVHSSRWYDLDPSSALPFFHFVLTATSNSGGDNDGTIVLEDILNQLQKFYLEITSAEAQALGWNFLRKGAWLCLPLSLINSGIGEYLSNHVNSVAEPFCNQNPKNSQSEEFWPHMVQSNKMGWLLNLLSTMLRTQLQVLQEAFILVTNRTGQFPADGFSPILLLKYTGLKKNEQDVLLQKYGCSFEMLEPTFGFMSKLEEHLKHESGINVGIFWRSFLHGFPSNSDPSSAILLSSAIIVREILCTLEGCLKIKDAGLNFHIETAVLPELLEIIMNIRNDRIFQCMHEKCEALVASIIGHQKELLGYSDLFALKQIEGLLAAMNSIDSVDPGMHELLVAHVVDFIEALQGDDYKAGVSKYYLGSDEEISEVARELFKKQRGDLLVLINSLDKCQSGTVNLKVLNFFNNLLSNGNCPGLAEKVQLKFLDMKMPHLTHWLESRLLGCLINSPNDDVDAKGSSTSLKESTMSFITYLTTHPLNKFSEQFHVHIVDGFLMLLDKAFTSYDLHTSKAYFSFMLLLLHGKPSMNLLLERTLLLLVKLVDSEEFLPGLKFLLSFLCSFLGDCGANKKAMERFPSKLSTNNSFGSAQVNPKSIGSPKNAEKLVLTRNPENASASIDCDATSADEDDDDGTSDGDLGSLDKEEEEDGNSERELASKVCTFTSSGSNFMEQHWYFCYTCDLTISRGCCSICAKVCHKGHRVVYSRSSRFFCDCGAGGVRGYACQCLKPRKFTDTSNVPSGGANSFQSFVHLSEDTDEAPDSDSDLDYDACVDIDDSLKLSISKDFQMELPNMLEKLDLESRIVEICERLLPALISQRDSTILKDKEIALGDDKKISYKVDLLQLKKAYKSGSLDLKIKADYPNSKELKSHLSSGSLTKSLLSISVRGRLAVGEGDKVAIFDVLQLIGHPTAAPVTADKANVKPLSRNNVRFEIVHVVFNPIVENYLAVAGYEDCQILTINPRGEVTDRLAVELALQGAYIRRVEWVPGSQVQLMLITNMFVKIYDLSQDSISPMHYFTLSDDLIVDAMLIPASMGKLFLLVLSETGSLFRLEVSMEGDVGAKALKDVIQVQKKATQSRGLSLYFSSTYRLLFLSYQDGVNLIGRLDANATSLTELSAIYEDDQEGNICPAGLQHWKELFSGSGIFICLSTLKSNAALAVAMSPHDLFAQNMRYAAGSLSLVGVAAYKPFSKDKIHCLFLNDDGSLQIYSYVPVGDVSPSNNNVEQTKKLGSNILNNRVYAGSKPEFPLDFFEKAISITADVKMSCDNFKNCDSEGIKQKLGPDDGFLESPSAAGFKITICNTNPDIVMVGARLSVGNTSLNHIPSEITVFQRVVKLDEGIRSWYDIPFTIAESLLADEEFTISIGQTFNGTSLPRIDSLEVYGRAKDEFGWKEKMDAILDMEAHVLGANAVAQGPRKKCRTMQAASIHEKVVADALILLSRTCLLSRSHFATDIEGANLVLNELKCKNVLETIFQSDKEPLLQSAACHVLQSFFPKREIYYHVKDTMRLSGVVKSFPMLISRIGIGGAIAGWVIKEFTSQMHAVSKIALNRRSNMVSFLKLHGSGVVDGLMQVLWGILDTERPQTQTINHIVIPAVELLYSYAECLALHGIEASEHSVAPAVSLLKKLLFSPYEEVQTSCSLAMSSRLLQVPFPKQTMLATDDTTENSAAQVPSSGVANGGNAQIMIEEDSTTSSVQYCCDGCSTVPILRRRWHCNVCPDFDLCEACYEVLDADRLPPPHSRDHPMSAIPIEIESVGVDGNDIHFSMDELNDVGIMPIAVDTSMLNSPSSVHVLETNETGNFSSSLVDQRIVTISASKRTVNSLLLRQLLEELKGWMLTTSGVRAIPVMQLFYRLSSAVGGPFMDSLNPENLDLEKFVKWFLHEIDLSKPFSAKDRSFFGEVSILVFMYFTLMLRNWHQPSGDSSLSKPAGAADSQDKASVQVQFSCVTLPSPDDKEKNEFTSQLIRACSILRQQYFLNYLMDILSQLVIIFKSSAGNFESGAAGSGCGSLLSVRRELPAGNFSPFFSDSYAKTHRADLFGDYHKLLLENTFRLVYSLVRPEKAEKSADKDKTCKMGLGKDLKLDGFQDVLCSYINNPQTAFIRRYARRLFLHLCGSKTHYYSVRDTWQFSNEVKKLYKLVNKTGCFQNLVTYDRSVKVVKCLSALSEVAGARPRNWQKYCLKHSDFIPFLVNSIFNFGEESTIQALKLLNLAFFNGRDLGPSIQKVDAGDTGSSSKKVGTQSLDSKKKRKGEEGNESGSDKSFMDMEQAVETFNDKDGSVLKRFIDSFLLEWNSESVRLEAKCILYGIWHHGKPSFKKSMLTALLGKVKFLPMYGPNIVECIELMTWILGKDPDGTIKQIDTELVSSCLTSDVINDLFDTLHSQNELLANHPNSRIYNTLSGLVDFDGYYLESEPCVACSCPELPYSRMKLESLKSESKFTDNRIIVKCTGSYTIQTVTMNVHDARKSKSVKVLNLYYNNRPVSDLSELKNNWLLWKRAKSCHLAFNQTELKVEFPIPITACNFMIELDSFYENLQASSLESLQCPRCSKPVTDKHGLCGNCHENAYQCRQCRNINYDNLDSFLCNECGYSKYGRFEFSFMAKQSFLFDNMETDDDMKKGLAAIEAESENAHRRYQQLVGFKKPLLKLISSIGEHEIDPQQKDTVQQMMVSLPGPSCKINRKIALIGVLYGEKCKAAFDSVSKSVQTLQGLRRVLMNYLYEKNTEDVVTAARFAVLRSPSNCYGCATTFVTQCMELLQVLSKCGGCKKQLVGAGILSELFENNIHQGPKTARIQARVVLCAFSEGDSTAVAELNALIQKKVMYCLEHHRSMDIALATREELFLLSETCALVDEFWEIRLRVAFQLLFFSIRVGAKHPSISEHVILPCLRMISQACTPPKTDVAEKEQGGKSTNLQSKSDLAVKPFISLENFPGGGKSPSDLPEKQWDGSQKAQDIPLLSYSEWERGASYLDFVRRQYKVSLAVKVTTQTARQDPQKSDYLALKYGLKWKRLSCKRTAKSDFSSFALGSWVSDLILSACSQSIRSEVCTLISLLCPQDSPRHFQLLNLLMLLLPATLPTGESAAEYFELFFKIIDPEAARLFLTARGCLTTLCGLIGQEVGNVNSQERSLNIDISQGFILYKLVELLSKFLELPNIRVRFMKDELLSQMLEALLVIRGLIVQKTKLISDCNKLLKDLLDGLMLESTGNKRKFIHACISGLQNHVKEKKGLTKLFILEQLCNMICPSKPEPVYLLILNKAHTQEEFIRGSMTKNPYSSLEIGPLMRDVKNKICHQLDLLGLLEDDFGMELLVAGNIISLDLSISQVYEQVWKKYHSQSQSKLASTVTPSSTAFTSSRDCPPMTVTYRLQGLDGEATEPMIKELEEEREELQDPEVEFAIAGAVRECGGLEVILTMIQNPGDDELKSNHEELASALNLLMYCCKIRENRRALLRLGALGMLLETARRAFSVEAMELAEGILLIVESLTMEANESDIGITESVLTITSAESGASEQAKKIVLMFLERLSHPSLKKSDKQQQNNEMLARILPYLTYGEPAAMEALIQHFDLCLHDWDEFDRLQKEYEDNPKVELLASQAAKQRSDVENFVRVSESLKTSSCGERLKDIILEKGITQVAVQFLRECFAVVGQAGYRSSTEWADGLKRPSIPLILSMLRGLSKGHLPTQRCIDEGGVLPLLHALEGVSGENEIGARAENLLDTLSDKDDIGDGFLKDEVRKLRHATRDEMRRRALRRREELLQGLGMRQEFASDGGERIVVSQPAIEGLEDVEEEEEGLACMVCREGYNLRPNEILGVYSYSKRVNLGAISSANGRGDCVYTTVSHFNIIHFQCHQEAKRADAKLRNPKKEWEGATLRNNKTLCNSIFPINGPLVPLAQYVRCVDQYWDNLNALGRADGSRLRLITCDIVLMLARFATGASFSTDSKGGGRESNARFLPFMIQMASHLLDQGSSNQQQRQVMVKAVAAYLSSSPPSVSPTRPSSSPSSTRSSVSASDETIQFMMVNSLLSESYESWSQHRLSFLQRGIYHAYMQNKHGKSSSLRFAEPVGRRVQEGSSTDINESAKLFAVIQPMLVYTGLIEQLQRFFKLSKGGSNMAEDSEGNNGMERWEMVMKERLMNVKEMVGFTEELLSYIEDMNSAVDLQEAFDVMGALADVLSAGFSTCENFVNVAISSVS